MEKWAVLFKSWFKIVQFLFYFKIFFDLFYYDRAL